jgi:hypothetical protein
LATERPANPILIVDCGKPGGGEDGAQWKTLNPLVTLS